MATGITPERSLAGRGEITARDACRGGKSLEFHLCEACQSSLFPIL